MTGSHRLFHPEGDVDVLDELLASDLATGWSAQLVPLLAAARRPGEPWELADEERTVAGMSDAVRQGRSGDLRPRRPGRTLRRVVAAKTTAVAPTTTAADPATGPPADPGPPAGHGPPAGQGPPAGTGPPEDRPVPPVRPATGAPAASPSSPAAAG